MVVVGMVSRPLAAQREEGPAEVRQGQVAVAVAAARGTALPCLPLPRLLPPQAPQPRADTTVTPRYEEGRSWLRRTLQLTTVIKCHSTRRAGLVATQWPLQVLRLQLRAWIVREQRASWV